MNNAGQRYLDNRDKSLWSAADRLCANVAPGDCMRVAKMARFTVGTPGLGEDFLPNGGKPTCMENRGVLCTSISMCIENRIFLYISQPSAAMI